MLSCLALIVCVRLGVCEPSRAQIVDPTEPAAQAIAATMRHGAPSARDDEALTTEGRVVDIEVLANDHAPGGAAVRVVEVTRATHGWVLVNGDDTLRYHPNTGFIGLDGFAYTIADADGRTATAAVTVRVEDAPDAPVAENQALRTDEDTELAIVLVGSDADADTLAFQIERFPAHGSLAGTPPEVSYRPDADYHGADAFVFSVNDGRGGRDVATVWIRVHPVADIPLAADDAVVTTEGMVVDIEVLANDRDPDGDSVRVVGVTRAANGWVLVNGDDTLRYQPHSGFTGLDGFAYTIADADDRTATAAVSVTVRPVR
jgi:hypothetical protein